MIRRKFALSALALIITLQALPLIVLANAATDATDSAVSGIVGDNTTNLKYQLLEPSFTGADPNSDTRIDPADYFSIVYKMALGAAVVLAVVMLVIAGIEYTAGGVSEAAKSDAKHRIQGALGGLLLAFFSFLLLQTINPQLVNTTVSVANQPIGSGGQGGPGDGSATGGMSIAQCVAEYAARPNIDGIRQTSLTSPNMQTLINEIKSRWQAKTGQNTSILGSIYTYEQNQPYCNSTRGNTVCNIPDCAHSVGSNHYGKESFKDNAPGYYGSNAADFGFGQGNEIHQYGNALIELAQQIAQEKGFRHLVAFCETTSGSRANCTNTSVDHVHIQIWPEP